MYVLINEEGEMFAGWSLCNTVITERHPSRAFTYRTAKAARKDLNFSGLADFDIKLIEDK